MTTYLIIGNGIAANTAAENIRKSDRDGTILMFTREKHCFYYIPALPEYLAGEKQVQNITIHNEAWYKQNNITLHLATDIIAVDPAKKTISAKDGRTFQYDKLLLATGGYSFVPPIKGVPADGVFSLRSGQRKWFSSGAGCWALRLAMVCENSASRFALWNS
jgi:nitrite reductase (NADH) large subunit